MRILGVLAIAVGPLVSASPMVGDAAGPLDARAPTSCDRTKSGFYWSYDEVPEALKTPPGFYWSYAEVPAAFKNISKTCFADGSCVTSVESSLERK